MIDVQTTADRYAHRRRRAQELQERYPFAETVLAFYVQLLRIQEIAYGNALDDAPPPALTASYAAEHVLPHVIELSAQSGPPDLVRGVLERFHDANFDEMIAAWLRSDELPGIDRYLARAASTPVLEALGAAAAQACSGPLSERHCPVCGGLPQVSYFAAATEDLVTPHRALECSRCTASWAYARMTCAGCGETNSAKLEVFDEIGEPRLFPHMRIDGCTTCSRYLLNVDLGRDRAAVPVVDEIAAIPLDLYARELGLRKIVPNAMGF